MRNPRYANAEGGLLIEQDNGVDIYVDSGELYSAAVNGDFGQISEYVAPAPEPEPVPQVVSRFQARAALLQSNLLTQAEDLIIAADEMSQLAWQDAIEFRRSSPLLNSMAAQLGLTDLELDDLFRLAATIEA